jgi:transposase
MPLGKPVQGLSGNELLCNLSFERDAVGTLSGHARQLIRVWVQKYEAGALDEDAQAADLLQEYEAKIAALERMVGRQALEIEFLKGALKNAPRPRDANTSVIAGPAASPSQKDAG